MSSSASSHVTRSHSPVAALAVAPQRIEDAIRILELVRRDDALRAGAAAAAGMQRVAFDLADVERLLVDVGEDAARRLAVEADARNDPVVAAILLRPARRLEVDVVVPLGRVGMRSELSCMVGHGSQSQGSTVQRFMRTAPTVRFDPDVFPRGAAGQREQRRPATMHGRRSRRADRDEQQRAAARRRRRSRRPRTAARRRRDGSSRTASS